MPWLWAMRSGTTSRPSGSALSIGVLTGGYARRELLDAGAVLVYEDAAELSTHLEDLALGAPKPALWNP